MEFNYYPDFLGDTKVRNSITEVSGSFEATCDDLPLIKAALRKSMPEAKPTQRLEYAARAFGFRTAAAMQEALKAASRDAPLIMTPLVGPLDDARKRALLQACQTPTEQARDAAIGISRAVIASRGNIDLPWDANGVRQQRHVVTPLSSARDFTFLPDLAPPDLRTIFEPTSHAVFRVWDNYWGDIPRGWTIEYLTEENTTDGQLARLRPALVGRNPMPDRLPVIRTPRIEKDSVRATMLLKDAKHRPVGFVTFRFTISPVSEAEADWLTRRSYTDELDQDALDYFRPKQRCDAWKGHLHIEATGDRYRGAANEWSKGKFAAWIKDDDRIKAAFSAMMEEEFREISYILSRTDSNHDDYSLGRFILDLTTNGYHIGEINYDEFALALHSILTGLEDLNNDGRDGFFDRDINMALCPTVYDYADGVFHDHEIEDPWGTDDEEDVAFA